MLCSYHYGPALLRFWFQTNLGRKNWASYLEMQAGKTFSYQEKTLSGLLAPSHLWKKANTGMPT